MIQVKTSAKCAGCVAKIAEQLNTFLTPEQWSIDLSSPDKLLTVKALSLIHISEPTRPY